MATKRSHNPKRKIARLSVQSLNALKGTVRYFGSPYHKRNPGDYSLTPPADPRPDTFLCDAVDSAKVLKRSHAQKLLEMGVSKGLVSVQMRNGFPQNIWSVSEDGAALEAQLDNEVQGTYHGYPLGPYDPFSQNVHQRWNES